MGIKAIMMGFDLSDTNMEVLKIMNSDPRRIGGIELTFYMPDLLNEIDAKTKTVLKHAGDPCSVMKSIHPI